MKVTIKKRTSDKLRIEHGDLVKSKVSDDVYLVISTGVEKPNTFLVLSLGSKNNNRVGDFYPNSGILDYKILDKHYELIKKSNEVECIIRY